MKIINFVFFIFIFLFQINYANALENKILVKIEGKVITKLDIETEIKYLKALNTNINFRKK